MHMSPPGRFKQQLPLDKTPPNSDEKFCLNVQTSVWEQDAGSSSLPTRTKLNDPTRSEQIVVSCSDWVGSFFACSSCISRATGFFDSGGHVSLGNSKQFKIREQNV